MKQYVAMEAGQKLQRLTILHASRAAVDPVAEYYAAQAPEWEITNILDDGVMRLLRARDWEGAGKRLFRWIEEARDAYEAEAILLTCSALPVVGLQRLKDMAPCPVMKIDEAMAKKAVAAGRRIGVLATFPATKETANDLLRWAAGDREIELVEELEAAALDALLQGDAQRHDELLLAAVERFRGRVDALVLAQVSMARLAQEAERRLGAPVFESLSTSLEALRAER